MTWDIRYSRDGEDHLESHPDAEGAIEAACFLIDHDCDVHGIWTGDLSEALDPAEILRLYNLRPKSLVP